MCAPVSIWVWEDARNFVYNLKCLLRRHNLGPNSWWQRPDDTPGILSSSFWPTHLSLFVWVPCALSCATWIIPDSLRPGTRRGFCALKYVWWSPPSPTTPPHTAAAAAACQRLSEACRPQPFGLYYVICFPAPKRAGLPCHVLPNADNSSPCVGVSVLIHILYVLYEYICSYTQPFNRLAARRLSRKFHSETSRSRVAEHFRECAELAVWVGRRL